MSNIIDSIQLSGVTYGIKGSGGTETIELTQAQYDALVDKDPNVFYIITDAQAGDLTNYYTKTETNTLLGGKADTATTYTKTEVDTALGDKQDTLVSGTNIKTINNESILGSGNIDIQGGGGGGKAVSGGTNISITTGDTADTINCTLPIKTNNYRSLTFNSSRNPSQVLYASAFGDYTTASGKGSFAIGKDTTASGEYSFVGGYNFSQAKGNESFSFGDGTVANKNASVAFGKNITTNNECEFSCGRLNKSVSTSATFGNSGNTLFSVGNGTSTYHNAFEIRQNGDIYITKDGSDVKLQDQLGGGSSYTAGDGIDITNDVISVTGKTDSSAFTTHTADTTVHVTSTEKATWNAKSDFSGSYNDLTDKPTIPTSASQLTNDSGYITSSALNGYATEAYVTAATNDMATKTWVGQQGYLTEHQSLSDYYTKSETSGATQISTALASKADTATTYTKTEVDTALASKQTTLTAGTNITIVDNVISAEGGGKTIEAGRGISITTSETADTVSFNLPIYSGTNLDGSAAGAESIRFTTQTSFGSSKGLRSIRGRYNSNALGEDSICFGINSFVRGAASFGVGRDLDSYGNYATIFGYGTNTKNLFETAIGKHNTSNSGSTEADNTLFSVGNGTSNSARHNAFEIRQNGDIYCSDGTNDVKLQDTITATSANTTALGGLKLVKLSQSEYDALSPNYDSNTLYVIVN